ncbi:bifunctional UDP-N-acetylglucosamine diphosphorylase/glucosamine-1-phosphate N-acetyltransferase GlmU [Holzapfeliella floricola]|uniref:Bifunctional protein GlmU n=1 Tax=Holzapfeliella floricola DSM 23037 = JCM 16512 TaxID=1423744 RepID=A0A0R2DTR1_9LACO|nr:bifunctional UDP-N-acetylglucosamine diphosphorylase/glucosamine-1-phosphate N-acetyltransferase GlmU [Holzapfeliella floricola]KRN04327.1 UDP-N-acetylglucosamine pyrophosphorylase N-acetylglucosamine-1-phosphate uridyltransferase [Holzapfeliella floricola DSM 23037 = JCM 16512]
MDQKNIIILAAGQGTRMKSKRYKVLHEILGRSMVDHVLTQVEKLDPQNIVTVVGHGADEVKKALGDRTQYVLQAEQLGTGHAVMQAAELLKDKTGSTIVANGDTPLLTAETFEKLFDSHQQLHAKATVLTAKAPNPSGYGRVIRNEDNEVIKIVEQKDASEAEKRIDEINTGVYCFDNQALFDALSQVTNDNAQNEYYITDVIEILKSQDEVISAYQMPDFDESMGVNDRLALSQATKVMRNRVNKKHLLNGVTIIDPENTYIDVDVEIGSDTVIEPGVYLQGQTKIGESCMITTGSKVVDSQIDANVTIHSSTIENSVMESHTDAGPYAHLRPQSHIKKYAHIGNFVEIKKAVIGEHTKVGHLTYVGDATLEDHINIGCGVTFVNYDGVQKFHTTVGSHSFIGSSSNIIAPVNIADHAFVAAGSTITKDVPKHAMGIARQKQTNKEDFWKRLPLAQNPDWN